MGRMLETLRSQEGRRTAVNQPEPETPVQECVVDWEIGEEVPYVEVGGPDKKVDLSPNLLLKHAPQTAQPPHQAVAEKVQTGAGLKVVNLTETRPMTVAFEPWPETPPAVTGISAEIITYHQPDHATSKEYAVLLDRMLAGLKTAQPNALLLIGLKPRVGTSTVLLNLAVVAAREQKHRVIVVDANADRAGLAQRLGRGNPGGLQEVIDGSLALEQAIARTALPSLHLLSAGSPIKKQRPLTAEAMTWLNVWLRERYDLIFIDGPTVEETSEMAVRVSHANGIYLVLPQGETSPAQRSIAQSISRMGGRLCGLIHTRFEMG